MVSLGSKGLPETKNRGVQIYGIEIMPYAAPIMQYDQETGVMRFPFDRQWAGYSDAPREGEKFVAVPGTNINKVLSFLSDHILSLSPITN